MRLSVRPNVSTTISMRSSQAGTQTAPSSMTPTLSRGKRSSTLSKISAESAISAHWLTAM
jgi:hypothetical protein